MIKGKTSSGFEFEIPKKRLRNYDLLEAVAEFEENPLVMTKVLKFLLGEEANHLKDHIRDEDGIVDIMLLEKEVTEIFNSQKDLKN